MQTATQSTTPAQERLVFSINEVAEKLGCSRNFIALEITRGRLRTIKLSSRCIRVSREDLARYLSVHASADAV
jgi:excisionase family DNA binding protein